MLSAGGPNPHPASEDVGLCAQQYQNSPHYRISQNLKALKPKIRKKYFMNDPSYVMRSEFSDGSCFFHSVVTALNLHNNLSSENPHEHQRMVFQNIKTLMAIDCDEQKGKGATSKFDDFLHKHLFVHDEYVSLSTKKQTSLGHKLRLAVRDSVVRHWKPYWNKGATLGNKKKEPCDLLKRFSRIHSKEHVRDLLADHTVWADVYMILFCMDVLDLNIWFIDDTSGELYCGVQGTDIQRQPTVFVLWTNHSHFQPIVKLECTPDTGKPYIKSLFTYGSDPVVSHVDMVNRQTECAAVPRSAVL